MMDKINLLGVRFSFTDRDKALKTILDALEQNRTCKVFTPNPEIVMEAYHDEAYRDVLNKGDLVVPDGIGIVIGARLLGISLPERVAGYDLQQKLFSTIKNMDKSVYFFGAKPGVAEKAAGEMEKKHQGLKIAGWHHGYTKDDNKVVGEILKADPDIVLVGLGAPRQEKFIVENGNLLQGKVLIGVGGSFDVMAGQVKRAPVFMQKLGMEWFFRLLQQPARIKRMVRLPIFLCKIMIEGRKHKN